MTILVCGEALVDMFVREAPDGLKAELALGGSPFNVAIGLARLGTEASFLGCLSRDVFGTALRARLAAENVDLAYAIQSDRLSTLSVVSLEATGHPAYAFHGEGKADRQVGIDDLPPVLGPEVTALVFGSYTLAVEPVASAQLALARREAGARVVSLDPNLRPTVTPDLVAWRAQFAKFLPLATLVKASTEDLTIAFPGADHRVLVESWFDRGVKLGIVTLGRDGAVAHRPGRPPLVVPGHPIDVVDTVGAGDSFHAALLARLDQRRCLTPRALSSASDDLLNDALTYAVAAAAIACSRRGADPPRHREVTAFAARQP